MYTYPLFTRFQASCYAWCITDLKIGDLLQQIITERGKSLGVSLRLASCHVAMVSQYCPGLPSKVWSPLLCALVLIAIKGLEPSHQSALLCALVHNSRIRDGVFTESV